MAIQKQFIVRYRRVGHVRFQVPVRLCEAVLAQQLTNIIAAIDGVSSVNLYRGQQKLSIRYDESQCSFNQLARQLFDVLEEMEQQGWFEASAPVVTPRSKRLSIKSGLKETMAGRWLGGKMQTAKETLQAAKLVGKLTTQGPKALIKDPEKATIDFFNDILVLYLIKVHWNRITQQWLVKPFTHRYEWLAVLYLFYLLVRSRRRQ